MQRRNRSLHTGAVLLVGLSFGTVIPFGSGAVTLAGEPLDRGGQRCLISRGPDEEAPVPDVLTLKDGRRFEVYFVQYYGERAVFFLQEDERFWVRYEVLRADVVKLERSQRLERDPLEPAVIERAAKQPVAKDEVLAGVFGGRRGRYTTWRLTFHSEINKNLAFAEDATEYGRFSAESNFKQQAGGETFAHQVIATGYYYLYAPGSVNNKEWVLVLAEVVERERDLSPEQGYSTRFLPYEAFIVNFSPERDQFHLDWANIGESSWGAVTGLTFHRRDDAPQPGAEEPRRNRRAESLGDDRATLARTGEAQNRRRRWGTSGWGPPVTYWHR